MNLLIYNKINSFLENEEIALEVTKLKTTFIGEEARMMELHDHDFVALVLLTPTISIALADNKISLLEELELNKLARRLSVGNHFFEKDPVINAMQFLIEDFIVWEDKFYGLIKLIIDEYFVKDKIILDLLLHAEKSNPNFIQSLQLFPYILVRFISILFFGDPGKIFEKHDISRSEFEKIRQINEKLQLTNIPGFSNFVDSFKLAS